MFLSKSLLIFLFRLLFLPALCLRVVAYRLPILDWVWHHGRRLNSETVAFLHLTRSRLAVMLRRRCHLLHLVKGCDWDVEHGGGDLWCPVVIAWTIVERLVVEGLAREVTRIGGRHDWHRCCSGSFRCWWASLVISESLVLILVMELWRVTVQRQSFYFVTIAKLGGWLLRWSKLLKLWKHRTTSTTFRDHLWTDLEEVFQRLWWWILNPWLSESRRMSLTRWLAMLTAKRAILCAMEVFMRAVQGANHLFLVISIVWTLLVCGFYLGYSVPLVLYRYE